MDPVQLPHEILLHISAFSSGLGRSGSTLLQQLLLHRPFYEYYTTCRQHCIQSHIVITTDAERTAYTIFGKYHRTDGPAIVYANGDQYWYQNGKYHHEDGPAIVYANGDQYWYQNSKYHREDGPAIIHVNGDQYWYQNGEGTGKTSD